MNYKEYAQRAWTSVFYIVAGSVLLGLGTNWKIGLGVFFLTAFNGNVVVLANAKCKGN